MASSDTQSYENTDWLIDWLIDSTSQANANANELAKRLKQSETLNVDLQRRVDELNNELQVAHSDAQRMQTELARLRVTAGELQERSDALARENKQLSGEFIVQ